ncbi:hypothetical protein LCGC14_1068910 [marine sediment metagenome]|uniref:Uncharacterized protein n=1 Tax=marine sediment metagenome TaxID=412755 RepID=A0A0F9Q1W4_9ZZZZ
MNDDDIRRARLRELAATTTAAMEDIYWLLSTKDPEYAGICEGAIAARQLHERLCKEGKEPEGTG